MKLHVDKEAYGLSNTDAISVRKPDLTALVSEITPMVAGYTSPETDSLQRDLPAKSSQFGTSWPTTLDKIKNFHLDPRAGPVAARRYSPSRLGSAHRKRMSKY